MRKLLALALSLLLLACPCALAQEADSHLDEDGALIENPIHDLENFAALTEAVPGVVLCDVPEEANTAMYSFIHGDPLIAQIQFIWGEDLYTYRAAALPADGVPLDIDGLYLPFDETETFENLFVNDEDVLVVNSHSEEGYAVSTWVRHDLNTQYSLFSETGGEPEMPIIELASILMPVESDWTVSTEE